MVSPGQPDAAEVVGQELVTLSRRLRNGAREIYAEGGLTFVEYSLLALISDSPGINAAALAKAASIDKSTASRQLAELRRRGLLRRSPESTSSRSQSLEPTPEALDILGEIRQRSGEAIAARLESWTPEDLDLFATLLHRYNNADSE
ncbi:MarR family winged helix-turn-helix transcriptional regulator [Gordonia otitidis]|uniref:MarR family transcriptional regulator n=1 Tax=Gordonia otitidis (strain DSM 44809 / CCUG 52243 / JCM 12355 / NBRC 100426 / IFM 10032) TaxID=1108044 RepID=H5THV4_GORO1|nr:MarR family transcriptional regulator [Gordonia otitidis]UEA59768.1 MarR family transcriptional regulator [Gordonia otitidis]GAB33062.1 putative MarR family transcriptional regulator [Gordonia otitidis NBRC 100426]